MLGSFTLEDWAAASAIATGLSALIFATSTLIALRSLWAIVRTHELQSVNQFYEALKQSEADRRFVMQEIDLLDPQKELTREEELRVKNVINFLNKVGMLMDMKLLAQKFVLSLTHTMIIRLCFVLIPFAAAEEKKIGGRYGRRLTSLAHQARIYHDASPNHRITKIKLSKKGLRNGEVIYETRPLLGLRGQLQCGVWRFQRFFHWYHAPRDLIPETTSERLAIMVTEMLQRLSR